MTAAHKDSMMKSELTYNQILSLFKRTEKWKDDYIENKTLKEEDLARIVALVTNKLNSNNGQERYLASHLILTFKLNPAKDKLIQRILDLETMNENGTMTYALAHLNCEKNLVDIFRILATQSYEAKCHAYNILCEQEFEFTKSDLSEMKMILKWVELNKEENQIHDEETLEMIKDAYEGFEIYLTNEG